MFINTINISPSEWPSVKSLQIINAGEGMEKKEPSYTVGGNVNWCNHCGELWRSSLKSKSRISKWFYNLSSGYTSRESYSLKRYIQPYFHSSAIYNSQTWRQTNCPLTDDEWWVDKKEVSYYMYICTHICVYITVFF